VRVEGQLIFNMTDQMLTAALAGFGLAYVPEDLAEPLLPRGVSGECLKTGVLASRDTTSITQAAVSRHRPLRCWSMRCDTGLDVPARAHVTNCLICMLVKCVAYDYHAIFSLGSTALDFGTPIAQGSRHKHLLGARLGPVRSPRTRGG
jgi:hypothetical protein